MSYLLRIQEKWGPKAARLFRFLVSGGTATATNLFIFYVATDVLHLWYIFSLMFSFSSGFFISFFLQKKWTFQDQNQEKIHTQMSIFLCVSVGNLVVNTILLAFSVEYLGLNHLLAQFIISGLIACVNYVVYKKWIFLQQKDI